MAKTRTMSFAKKKYAPVMCQRLVYHFADGGTRASFLRQEEIDAKTFRNWLKQYEEFKDAYDKAKVYKEAYHQDELKEAPYVKIENPVAYKAYLHHVCQFKEDKEPTINVHADKVDEQLVEDCKKFSEKWSEF